MIRLVRFNGRIALGKILRVQRSLFLLQKAQPLLMLLKVQLLRQFISELLLLTGFRCILHIFLSICAAFKFTILCL